MGSNSSLSDALAALRRPRANWVLAAINVAVFGFLFAAGADLLGGPAHDYLRYGANFAPLTTSGEWWRLAAAGFVHLGIVHLAVNMWALWQSARLAEDLYGRAQVAALYVFATACGGIASMLWKEGAISAGASPAVFGMLGALLAGVLRRPGAVPAAAFERMRFSLSLFVIYSLYFGFRQAGIDNAAHLGGLCSGFLIGLIMPSSADRHRLRRFVAAATVACVLVGGGASIVPETSLMYRQALLLQKEIDWFAGEDQRLDAVYQEIVGRGQRERTADPDVAKELKTRLMPQWAAAVERLAAVAVDEAAPLRRDYELLLEYASARRDLVAAIGDFLAAGGDTQIVASRQRKVAETRRQFEERQKR